MFLHHLLLVCAIFQLSAKYSAGNPIEKSENAQNNWELLNQVNVSGVLPVFKYRSLRTGLTVVISKAESPIVNGYFCLPTEAFDDDGLPHTLEHLIFLGSEDYPYKEVLDLMANRCLADRTNAWTDTDHTCYTVNTAGSGGFLNILPIYLDHILYPLLREEDFMTEVHHITGQGQDSGVVYSEMQGVENKASNIIYFAMIRHLYPGNNSYIWQTGGKLENLRESTSIEKVRAYHKKFYRPENLRLVVTGNIDSQELFETLDKVESKILQKRVHMQVEPFEKPFQQTLAQLDEDVTATVRYPSKDEKFGVVSMGWRIRGPLWESIPNIQALSVLTSYLTSSPVSPLQRRFVEISQPLSTNVDSNILMNSEAAVSIDFENVPIESMEDIDKKFKEFKEEVKDKGALFWDMEHLHTLIKRMSVAHQMRLENSPHQIVPDPAILDMLYGRQPEHFELYLKKVEDDIIEGLLNKTPEFWTSLFNETFSTPRVLLLSYPSDDLDLKLMVNETKRIENQIETLGPEGLQKADEKISSALKSQKLPTSEVLQSVPVADATSISFKSLNFFNYTTKEQPDGFDLRSIPFRFHVDHSASHFVRFYIFFDTSKLSDDDIKYLVLLNTLWMQCPLRDSRTGHFIPLNQVIMRRSQETLSMTTNIGYKGGLFTPGSHSHLMMFFFDAEIDKYMEAVSLLRQTLFNVEFTVERAQTVLSQLLNSIPGLKLSASKVVSSLSDNMFFNRTSSIHHSSFLRQQKYLAAALEDLRVNPGRLIGKLHEIRREILRPENSFAFMTADVNMLNEKYGDRATAVWINFFPEGTGPVSPEELSRHFPTYSENEFVDRMPDLRHAVAVVPGSDSCYVKQIIPFEITDWEDSEVAAVRVMLQYMTDRMYDKIRGKGWTYGISMSVSVTEGRIAATFVRSSHVSNAYSEFREIITNYTSGVNANHESSEVWDHVLLDSARGSQIYDWAKREDTSNDHAGVSVKSYLRGTLDPNYNQRFVQLLGSVSLEDVHKAAMKYLPRFLDPHVTQTAIVCGPSDVAEIKYFFGHFKINLIEIDDLENSILAN